MTLLPSKEHQGGWEYTGKLSIVFKEYLDPTVLTVIMAFLKNYGFNVLGNIATHESKIISGTEKEPTRRGVIIQSGCQFSFISYGHLEQIDDSEGRILWPR